MELIKLNLASYGIIFFLQHKAYPFLSKQALLKEMLECTFCTGFHGGWIAFLLLSKQQHVLNAEFVAQIISWGFAGASAAYIVDTIISKIEEYGHGDDSEVEDGEDTI